MPDTEQVTQPSLGSNEPGTETHDVRIPSSVTAGSDTQAHLAAKSGQHTTHEDKVENVKNNLEGTDFATSVDTDE